MCLGIPMRVEKIEGIKATVELGGIRKQADIRLLDNVKIGDYIIIHVGFAIEKIDPESAKETLELLKILPARRTDKEKTK